jgi:hypothetical protein
MRMRMRSQPAAPAAALPPRGVSRNRSDVLNPANLHLVAGQDPECGLRARAGLLGVSAAPAAELDMDGLDVEGLELVDDVHGCEHGGVGRRLLAVGLDLHAPGDPDQGLAAGQVGHVDEGVVPGGQDVAHPEHDLVVGHHRAVLHHALGRGLALCRLLHGLALLALLGRGGRRHHLTLGLHLVEIDR